MAATSGVHRYHRDLPETRSWGFERPVLGPNLEAFRDRLARIGFRNELGPHVLAPHVDVTMHGVTEEDRTDPRFTVHLHGGANSPDADGHPLIGWRNGGGPSFAYGNRQEAATLWYHDHAMGLTRLDIQAGLAGIITCATNSTPAAPTTRSDCPAANSRSRSSCRTAPSMPTAACNPWSPPIFRRATTNPGSSATSAA
ncbi:multicopper oxidase domain-containing protein [Nocardia tengchongensis]|uniref:multicopper oxidase domain-containing protein n=1 Tax=Nocardia tengchongensis TaxID=2055889 RepID=UPI0036CFF039